MFYAGTLYAGKFNVMLKRSLAELGLYAATIHYLLPLCLLFPFAVTTLAKWKLAMNTT
jgi:hypothetical protein